MRIVLLTKQTTQEVPRDGGRDWNGGPPSSGII